MTNQQHASSGAVKLGPEVEISAADDRKYRQLTLPNRLQVLLISDESADKAAAAMDVNVGQL
jgi:insulysin